VGYSDHPNVGDACDLDFGIRLAADSGAFFFLDQYTAKYRVTGVSVSRKADNNAAISAYNLIAEVSLPPDLEPLRRDRLASYAPMVVSGLLAGGDKKTARQVYASANYPWWRRLSARGLLQAGLFALPVNLARAPPAVRHRLRLLESSRGRPGHGRAPKLGDTSVFSAIRACGGALVSPFFRHVVHPTLANRIRQFRNLVRMKRRALWLGVPFRRARDFEIPRSIFISGHDVPITCPAGDGHRTDLIDLFLRDSYHLGIVARDKSIRRIVDIGANCGWFSLVARAYFPDAAISAYEPNPIVLPALRSNVANIDVEVCATAVGGAAGWVRLEHPEGATNLGRTVPGGDIPCVPIREVLDRTGTVDLLKLDCEGAEWEILNALPSSSVRWLTMEYHLWGKDSRTHADMRELLGKMDFRVIRQIEGGVVGMMLARRC
jgi:FkbM family methyltransferase